VAQDSALHWAAHAQLERQRGKLDDTRKVYQIVLLFSKPPATDLGLLILWYNWARKPGGVIKIILHLVDIEITNSGVASSGQKENWKIQPID